jgi:colicin import membrane protein
MVAIERDNNTQVLFDSSPGPEEHQKLSPKQLKRIEEQKAREEKKLARRKAKAMQKDRRAAEREHKEAKREQRIQEELKENRGLSAKEMEEKERLEEEKRLFEQEFLQEETVLPTRHVKKSALDSNRLGGKHMC